MNLSALRSVSKPDALAYDLALAIGPREALVTSKLIRKLYRHHPPTGWHSVRVALLASASGWCYSILSAQPLDQPGLILGCLLHDIGKGSLSSSLLSNQFPLSESEQRLLRLHPVYGYRIVTSDPILRPARSVVLSHHERWDGAGYPCRLPRSRIPTVARIASVCDAFDAMTSDRGFRPPMLSRADAIRELISKSGSQFAPRAVEALLMVPSDTLDSIIGLGPCPGGPPACPRKP